ncbi:MAG TPA: isoprenylcysteine carboxylmethyltransferase family protein [Pyrinomonadaceae bacterium]|jgi:protein-S-isoprenylcysteine O-methyltransferase Ste14
MSFEWLVLMIGCGVVIGSALFIRGLPSIGWMLLLRTLFWAIIPAVVVLYIPYLIVTRWQPTTVTRWGVPQFLSLIPITIGSALFVHCIWLFAAIGRGTLSPLDPPKRFVVRGLYRYVRNPMYVVCLVILFGEALFFQSTALLKYALGWFVLIHLVVVLIEEPTLQDQFGESYARYRRKVRRWVVGRPYDDNI